MLLGCMWTFKVCSMCFDYISASSIQSVPLDSGPNRSGRKDDGLDYSMFAYINSMYQSFIM